MLIKEENEGGGKAQSTLWEVIPQSSQGRFAQVRKVAHPKAVSN